MKKNKALLLVLILLLSISLTTILVSCNKTTNEHTHTWGKYSYVDESTHKRVCKDNILHEEIYNHRYDDGKVITSPTDINPGTEQYECLDCGYKKLVSVAPTGNHVFNQEIVDNKYLKKFVTNQSAIYYKSCECGAYGNDDYLFENSTIPNEYAEVEYIQGAGKQFVDTGIKKSSSITTAFNTTLEDSAYNQNILTQTKFNNIQGEVVAISDKTMSTSGWGLRYNSQTSNEAISIASADQLSLESEAYYKLTFDACINTTESLTQKLSAGIVSDRLTANIKTINLNSFELSKTLSTYSWAFKFTSPTNASLISLMYYVDQKSNDDLYVVAPIYITNISLIKVSSPCSSNSFDDILPGQYQGVEYIESTGTQWIDTGFTNTSYTYVQDMYFTACSTRGLMGFTTSTNCWWGCHTTGVLEHEEHTSIIALNERHVYSYEHIGEFKVDGILVETNTTAANTNGSSYALFAIHNSFYAKARLYSFKVYDKEQLISHCIPCYSKYDGTIGIYDIINNKFHSNAGAGEFLKGSDKTTSLIEENLPDDYQLLDYISSTGAQFIDTGVIDDYNTSIEVSCATNEDLYWSIYGTNNGLNYTGSEKYPGGYFYYYDRTTTNAAAPVLEKRKFVLKQDKNKCYRDGELVHTYTLSNWTDDRTMYLFGMNSSVTGELGDSGKTSIFYAKIWQNGVLIKFFVPCYNKGSNEIGMYELINGVFYANKGTGTFIKGEEKSSTNSLPNNYEALTYIGTTGTQFIDTGYKPTNHTKVEMQLVSTDSYGYWFGAWDDDWNKKAFCFCNDGTGLYFGWDSNEAGTSGETVSDGLHLICLDGNKAYVDGELVRSVTDKDFSLTNSLHLFGQNRKGVNYIPSTHNQIKCAYVKIYENNVLMMHLISCFNKTTGDIGMYDLVNNVFYTNNGDGTFVKGDVTSSIIIDDTNVGILKGNMSSLYGYDFGKIYDYQIYENGSLIRSFVPVVKMSDSQTGLYELIEGKFYPSSTNVDFERGRVLIHDFDNGTIISNATYKDAGETVYKCSICGEELHYRVNPYSYKVAIENSNDYSIKIFKDYDYSSYETGNELYTRNLNTYNYSKVNNYVMFEVLTQKQIDSIISSDLSVIIVNIKDNIYIIKGFSSNAELTINLLG